nr:hypothetical protein [Kibdelosporangium sp. MJ126-NF4]
MGLSSSAVGHAGLSWSGTAVLPCPTSHRRPTAVMPVERES